jgi:hypothetical protein
MESYQLEIKSQIAVGGSGILKDQYDALQQ